MTYSWLLMSYNAALNVKNTYLFYVLCRLLVLISAFLYLSPFLSGQNKYYLFGLALVMYSGSGVRVKFVHSYDSL